MLGEVSDHVAAGNPSRENESFAGGLGSSDRALHRIEMGFRTDRFDPVMDGLAAVGFGCPVRRRAA
jgi:hypothetical protein